MSLSVQYSRKKLFELLFQFSCESLIILPAELKIPYNFLFDYNQNLQQLQQGTAGLHQVFEIYISDSMNFILYSYNKFVFLSTSCTISEHWSIFVAWLALGVRVYFYTRDFFLTLIIESILGETFMKGAQTQYNKDVP